MMDVHHHLEHLTQNIAIHFYFAKQSKAILTEFIFYFLRNKKQEKTRQIRLYFFP